MAWNDRYKCRECNCNLDPGEGDLCDDCRDKQYEDTKIKAVDILKDPELEKSLTNSLEQILKAESDNISGNNPLCEGADCKGY